MFEISFDNPVIENDMREINEDLSESKRLFGKSVYISGASGMIASYMVSYLIWLNETQNADISIYAGIRSEEKARLRFGEYASKDYFHLISADVTKPLPDDLKLDFIIHAASLASPQYYGSNPVETMLPNVLGTYNLLDHSKKNKPEGFLFLSSGAVYGTVTGNDEMLEESQGVLDFLDTGNTYAESKRCGEALCHSYYKEYGVNVCIARVHHTYGPTVDIDNDSRVYSEFVGNIIRNQDIVLKSSGGARRAFCYVTDTVTGLFMILLNGAGGEAYNLGNPDDYISILELADMLADLFKEKNINVVCKEREDSGYRSCAAPLNAPISIAKVKKLGWSCNVSLRDGFSRTVKAIEYFNCNR